MEFSSEYFTETLLLLHFRFLLLAFTVLLQNKLLHLLRIVKI